MTSAEPSPCPPSGTNPDGTSIPTTCKVVAGSVGAEALCVSVGASKLNDPCMKAEDCAEGLGCVATETNIGICRAYCCGDVENCPQSTYCTTIKMAGDIMSPEPLRIPVCEVATQCELLNDAACPVGKACALVRADGTTSCVEPGLGKLGEPCPCAKDHVCSKEQNMCLKICKEDGEKCPNEMFCQTGSGNFPKGYGVCVK